MDIKRLENYLHSEIPLSNAMAIKVRVASDEQVVLYAPLEPNINHMDTIFGGSASAVAILSAWCLVYSRLEHYGLKGHIVIHKNTMHYDKPITAGFTATAQGIDQLAWSKLASALARKRMARLSVNAILECDGQQVGHLEGAFVVLPAPLI
ncbi:MAG TPA: YiiD C-terminal domain-containing protein [Aquirhabdus sp.]